MNRPTAQPPAEETANDVIRILIVEDHPVVSGALRNRFEAETEFVVTGEVQSGTDAISMVQSSDPDVAVVDIGLDDSYGLDLIQTLRSFREGLEVVVYSMYEEEVFAGRALQAGAKAYLEKDMPSDYVVDAIRTVAQGEVYVSESTKTHLISRMTGSEGREESSVDQFTDRELAVFLMLSEGDTIDDIADQLCLSRKTVETYRRRVREKLGIESTAELMKCAIEWRFSQS